VALVEMRGRGEQRTRHNELKGADRWLEQVSRRPQESGLRLSPVHLLQALLLYFFAAERQKNPRRPRDIGFTSVNGR
jgi:hypothetical protein